MRVIFTSIIGTGHFTPLLPYAIEMQNRGHEVRFATPRELSPKITAAGLIHIPVGRPTEEERNAFFEQLSDLPPAERNPYVLSEFFGDMLPRTAYPELKIFAEEWKPNLIVREAGEYAGALIAEFLGIAHVRVSVSNGHTLRSAFAPFDRLRQELGLEPDAGHSLRSARAYSSFPASMEPENGDGAVLPQFRVSSAIEPRIGETPDWVTTDHRPQIYMTFGTVMGSSNEAKDMFRAALDAVGKMDLSVLMTTGPSIDIDALGSIPKNVVLRDYVPQNEVFPHVSAVLCHGGSGSMLGALAAGLPVVITPIGADQPDNAKALEPTGAGISVYEPDYLEIADALDKIITDPSYKIGAQRIQAEMAAQANIGEAVDDMLRQVRVKT